MTFGRCKLTGKQGTFVASHLLPKSLTKPSQPGRPFVEAGHGSRPVRRWDSWFDKELVIRSGEDILARFDAAGIEELRKHMLLWSGRDTGSTLPNVQLLSEEHGFGIRQIQDTNAKVLRMFFLSLLWRSAASNRREVAAVTLASSDLEQLRLLLLNDEVGPKDFFPIALTQLTEIGEPHNFAPMATEMAKPPLDGIEPGTIPTFRFYFNGLIAHIFRPKHGAMPDYIKGWHIGESDLIVSTQRTRDSFQNLNLIANMREAVEKWPHVISRI